MAPAARPAGPTPSQCGFQVRLTAPFPCSLSCTHGQHVPVPGVAATGCMLPKLAHQAWYALAVLIPLTQASMQQHLPERPGQPAAAGPASYAPPQQPPVQLQPGRRQAAAP